jgi:hypothetical protein
MSGKFAGKRPERGRGDRDHQMHDGKSRIRSAAMILEMACHTLMGIALGLGFSFAVACVDTSSLAVLIAHSSEPKVTTIILVSFFTLAFGVGATLTGFVFTMMEKR